MFRYLYVVVASYEALHGYAAEYWQALSSWRVGSQWDTPSSRRCSLWRGVQMKCTGRRWGLNISMIGLTLPLVVTRWNICIYVCMSRYILH